MDERRVSPFCNLYAIHCKDEFEQLKSDVRDIKRALVGNGDNKDSLLVQATLNTNHRIWMETFGRAWLGALSVIAAGSGATVLWYVFSHIKPGGVL